MSPDPHLGEGFHVPCRHCGRAMIAAVAEEGVTTVTCPKCREQTRVKMTKSGGTIKVRTAPDGD